MHSIRIYSQNLKGDCLPFHAVSVLSLLKNMLKFRERILILKIGNSRKLFSHFRVN